MELATAVKIAQVASTAFSFIGGMQDASAQEAYAQQQQRINEMQARNAQAVAERNAQIIQRQAEYTATQQEKQAGQERAASQRTAQEERRRRDLAVSRAIAVGAASGAGSLDPTALDITGELTRQGELNALNALFTGESAATTLETQAGLTRYEGDTRAQAQLYGGESQADLLRYQGATAAAEGKSAAASKRLQTIGTAFSSGTSLYDKYAPKKVTETSYYPNTGTTINWYG